MAFLKVKTTSHFSMENRTLIYVDLLAMNVSWTPKDLALFEIEFDLLVSTVCTIARFITFFMAIVVHRAFYKLMKRLPGRAVNQVIYPYMVSKSITTIFTTRPQDMQSEMRKILRILSWFTVDFRQCSFKIHTFSWTPKLHNFITK